jgi:hypothetical protein
LQLDRELSPRSYLQRVKVIIWDTEEALKNRWNEIKEAIEAEKVAFAHYNFSKVKDFLEVMVTPHINLTIFVKKALPKFYEAYLKLAEYNFLPLELTASIVSKNELLNEVFED